MGISEAAMSLLMAVSEPSHLDCHYNEAHKAIVCPPNPALEGPPTPAVKSTPPASDWNTRCARRFKSFNPKTGKYKDYRYGWKRCNPDLPR